VTESYDVPGNCASSCSLSVCTQVGIPGGSSSSQGTEHKTGRPPVFPVANRTKACAYISGEVCICEVLCIVGFNLLQLRKGICSEQNFCFIWSRSTYI